MADWELKGRSSKKVSGLPVSVVRYKFHGVVQGRAVVHRLVGRVRQEPSVGGEPGVLVFNYREGKDTLWCEIDEVYASPEAALTGALLELRVVLEDQEAEVKATKDEIARLVRAHKRGVVTKDMAGVVKGSRKV